MKIIITADFHCGFPQNLDGSLWAMNVIKQFADESQIENVFVLGDLYHDRYSLGINVINLVYDFFSSVGNQKWLTFPGNHDMFLRNSWKINSLKPLKDIITIIEDIKAFSLGNQRFFVIPFIQYESAYMTILKKVEEQANESDILLTHIGVKDSILNSCFLLKSWNHVTFSNSIFKKIFTGHFHCMQKVGTKIYYPGSPIPFKFDEEAPIHGFYVYDTQSETVTEIDIFDIATELGLEEGRPANFITIDEDNLEQPDIEGNKVRILITEDYTNDELEKMKKFVISKGAKHVSWFKKQEEKPIPQTAPRSKFGDDDLFTSWIDFDKPQGLNKDLLLSVHQQIAEEAEDIISRSEEDSDL